MPNTSNNFLAMVSLEDGSRFDIVNNVTSGSYLCSNLKSGTRYKVQINYVENGIWQNDNKFAYFTTIADDKPFITSFIPAIKGSITPGTITLSLERGLCYSVGKLKFIHIHVVVDSISGSPTGDLIITGPPNVFPEYETPLALGITSYLGVDLNERYVFPLINTNGTITLISAGGLSSESAISVSVLTNNATLQVVGLFISNE